MNEHTFALMDPPYILDYKNTNDHWQMLYKGQGPHTQKKMGQW